MPVAVPPTDSSSNLYPVNYSHPKGPAISPTSITSPANHENRHGMPVAATPTESSSHLSPVNYSHPKGPTISPTSITSRAGPTISPTSITSPANRGNRYDRPVAAPSTESSSHLSPVNHSLPKVSTISPTSITSPGTPQNGHGMPVAAPPKEFSRHLSPVNYSHPKRPAVSPAPTTPPANYGRYGMPVPVPPKDISSPLSPQNYSHKNGSFPVISPAPHEAGRPSYSIDSPFASHPQPPVQRIFHSTAPAPVVSFRQLTTRQRTGSPASAPSPQSRNPASSNPPAVLPKHNREHHAPLPYIQGPVQSPVLSPLASTSGKPRAPQLQPFHSLPPPPPRHSSPKNHAHPKISPAPATPPANYGRYSMPVPAPPKDISSPLSPKNYSHTKGSFPVISPAPHESGRPSYPVHSPFASHPQPPVQRIFHSPAPAPVVSFHQPTARQRTGSPASAPSPQSRNPAPSHSPTVLPKHSREHHAPPPYLQGPSVSQVPFHSAGPIQSPVLSPSASASGKPRASQLQPFHSLPPPPPNQDCTTPLSCPEPFTSSPPGSSCACVMPIRVGLRLSIALFTFFPLVSELAQEIASGVFMKQSQVRIMGANATTEEYDKTIVLIDLVPLGGKFDSTTAFSVYEKFWDKQVFINPSFFGDYDVLYVIYPGLPPSPPMAPGSDNGAYGNDNNRTIHPLAADVRKQKQKQNGTVIAIIVLSAVIALVLCAGAAWVFLLKHRELSHLPIITPQMSLPPFSKASVAGGVPTRPGSRPGSASASFNSSIATCAGSAKTFSLAEMERATSKFNDSRIIGEGGFGRVYEGTLEDTRRVAIKVLKRDDQQGSREFLAEVEMLSRLHHRNLVKLIGICTEEHIRCLVYELVPNGSVESHLYGADKQSAPLDWNARLKIALGAARGLAYLHEDSSPRVIHRDFKASNILLEDDLTPKVSDFGLARTALDEGNGHISTRVMGTFGYVAPEYAMTGHLLVKSDVYSYGVVLLELLTGRKPVDMLRPPGQENLVTWARPLLTSKDGLETIVDPSLGTIPFDRVAKVAAIASMCVQPEVDQRPFMGEVVQALKLVCNEGNEYRGSGSFSQEEISTQDTEERISTVLDLELERVISASDIFSTSARFTRDVSGSFRRYSRSGPLRTSRSWQSWHRARGLSSGSASERRKVGTGLENGD
ncbi:receptor-like serine/threonine-protein kinase ALE2 isoform X12 [Phoenix dactylifera]|uniref:Receptor-like serine/threonine-protein kinase ALE2 isoform X12 n=1 Tax=Phoenix dactylifera TaxID=42345 RepID=A0A8B9ADG5_PHODC|nr:receptor-like serine/threonine-protein kinase ALE2 isoform X12 [Phoenix dactylifera]